MKVDPATAGELPSSYPPSSSCCKETCALHTCEFGSELAPERLTDIPSTDKKEEMCCQVKYVDITSAFPTDVDYLHSYNKTEELDFECIVPADEAFNAIGWGKGEL